MTVSNESARTSAVGTGAEQTVPFTFPITNNSDIVVTSRITATGVETLMAETTDYTVVNNGESGGSITTVTPFIANTLQIHIVRDTPNTQGTDLQRGGAFNANNVEAMSDKATKLTIENVDGLDRTLKFPTTDPSSSFADMPNSIDRANKVLSFDVNGIPTASDAVPEGSVSFSTYGEALVGLANAASNRDVLRLGTTDPVEFAAITGTTGTFSGAVSGTTGTFSGEISGTIATIDNLIAKGPMVDVVAFGADKAGVSESSAEIQAAMDSLSSGGVVFFPAGTYIIDTTLLIPNGVSLIGQLSSSTIKLKDSTTLGLDPLGGTARTMITMQNGWASTYFNIHIKDLTIDGNKANNSQAISAISMFLAHRSSVQNCEIKNVKTRHGIFARGFDEGLITGNKIHDFDGDGIDVVLSNYVNIIGNSVYDGGSVGGIGIELEGRTGTDLVTVRNAFINIIGNTVHDISGGHGILVIGTDGFTVNGNSVNAVKYNGIEVLGSNWGAITGNTIEDCSNTYPHSIDNGSCIRIWNEPLAGFGAAAQSKDLAIVGNFCRTAIGGSGGEGGGWGIEVLGDATATHQDIVITGNNTRTNTTGGIRVEHGIRVTEDVNINLETVKVSYDANSSYGFRSISGISGLSTGTTKANNLRGTVTFAGAATASVTFGTNEPDATYFLSISGDTEETFWWDTKAAGGFNLNSSNATSTAIVDWMLIR
jgi:parallel beta-helix repeat protein